MQAQNTILDGRYRLIRKIGHGGMGTVYLAENIKLGTHWAVKMVEKSNTVIDGIYREIEILKKLNHHSLPRIVDVIETEDAFYIVQDYIEGISLDELIKREGYVEESKVIQWGIEICEVLKYLHGIKPNPVIYRDMKPSNIILTPSGTLKLVDFGIAREYRELGGNDTVYIGTRGYAAPEQYGLGQTDERSDIYSLGITLIQLATGKWPASGSFDGNRLLEAESNISDELAAILKKCVQPEPNKRYQTADELCSALKALVKDDNEDSTVKTGREGFHGYRRLVLTVWDNTEFACELAYIAAKTTGLNVLLADMDLLAPKADLFLNVSKFSPARYRGIYRSSGINVVMDEASKNTFVPESIKSACVKRREIQNLYILTGSYSLEDYEYYEDSYFVKLIEYAYRVFDLVILAVNKSIYDSFTVIALKKSDYNIIAVNADMDKIREFNRYLVFLENKQNIPIKKSLFVAYEYNPLLNLEKYAISESTGGCFIGRVSFDKARSKCRNLKIPYVRRMSREVYREYLDILRYFNILPKPGPLKVMKGALQNLLYPRRPDLKYPLRQ